MAKKVALLVGGWSAEREVSLNKGKAVEKALIEGGYDVTTIDVTKDLNKLIEALTPKPDAVFNNLYGTGGEDGTIQAVLDMLEIPYTHSPMRASAIAMDKPLTKALAGTVGIPSAYGVLSTKEEVLKGHVMEPPYVVKPPREGSSVGIRLIMENDNQKALDEESWTFGDEVLVEKYVPGRELTVAILDGKAQAVTEIIAKTKFFDYEAKYEDQTTEYIMPAKIPETTTNLALEYAERLYTLLGCKGLARCDFRYDESQGEKALFLLEINTQPGCTPESIGPSQVIYNGTSFVALCAHLIETASCQRNEVKLSQKDENRLSA